jgi:hypothetical protein
MRPRTNCGNIELPGLLRGVFAMKNLDLIDWTIQEAEHSKTEWREPGDVNGKSSLDQLFAVLERESLGPASPEDPVAQIASAPSIQMAADGPTGQPSSDVVVPLRPDIVSNLPALTQAARSTSSDLWVEAQMSNLLKAIIEPDIYIARADRDRAIALRWVLRDIKSNRLNWSPVNQHDLQILIIMGLVEMRDDGPVLMNAGVSAIV